ncbi:porin [Ramlibacter sp.]|uniref:porin n=1 Tax=Ramlibacter sp. TaxID=1917967 RepID=UPI001810168D|nr:porin [Ramlibacter sp.]MBA2675784.1 porin [Ramlibacter sp.]
MKKSLIALAVMAAAGAASAQSSVTLFGVVDATVQRGSGSVSSKTQLGNSGYNSSRLGFRGTEDLGGGMSASFWLEAGVANDNGSGINTNTNNQGSGLTGGGGLTFNRRSTVSLAGGWGELRMGRDYSPQFWNLTVFDPFGTNGVGTTQTLNSIITGPTQVRASNSIGYFLPPNLGGFYGQVQYYMGENSSGTPTEDDGKGYGLRVGFASGPFNVAVAFSKTDYLVGNSKQANIGGQWDFGVAKLMAHYARDKGAFAAGSSTATTGLRDGKGWLVGTLVPVGAGEIRASYSRYSADSAGDPTSKKFALGYVHNLSKRTALYVTAARVKNSGGATQALNGAVTGVNGSSTGYDLGIRHSF